VFADGTAFSAKPDSSTPPLLTISVPLGLQYGSNPGSIQVQGTALEVGVGQTLALVGGNVQLNGAALYTSGEAPGGRVELGGLAGEGTVRLVANGSNLGLSFPVGVVRGDVSLSNGAVVDVTANGGGSIGINAKNLTMTQESILLAGIASDSGARDAVAGNIEINATGVIDLDESYILNEVFRGVQGQGGDVNITTSQLRASGGTRVGAVTFGDGNGGSLTINASKGVQVIGTFANGRYASSLLASAEEGARGNAGDLTINTGTLLVRDGAQVNTSSFGEGNGGNLTINASNGVQVIGTSADGQLLSGLFALNQPGVGKAGDMTINTGSLLVRDGAVVSASTLGQGEGGNLTINASKDVQVIGTSANGRFPSRLRASAERGSRGKAGDLTINTATMLVRDGAQVSASTAGEGNGGNLTVNASNQVQVIGRSADGTIGSVLGVAAQSSARGKAGDLTINTATLLVRDGAQVDAGTYGEGEGGNLTVNASEGVELIGTSADGRYASGLFASAERGSRGKAGDLTINTATLLVRDGATVTVSHLTGQAGNMTIRANSLRLNRGNLFAVTAKSDAQGGANIILKGLDLLRMDNESLISANALNLANGGNITIGSTLIVATPPTGRNGSDVTANAGKGNGGAVNVTTQGLFGIQFRPRLTPKNDITVSSDFGVNGTFQLITPGVDPSRGLTNLPTQVFDASNQIAQTCTPGNVASQGNSFVVTGSGGLPPSPDEPLSPDAVWVDWGTHPPAKAHQSSSAVSPKASSTPPASLVEAQGWEINDRGEVELTAATPTTTPHISWHKPLTCPHS
jgi:large exoprotein involved in heme utilization and adhesion